MHTWIGFLYASFGASLHGMNWSGSHSYCGTGSGTDPCSLGNLRITVLGLGRMGKPTIRLDSNMLSFSMEAPRLCRAIYVRK